MLENLKRLVVLSARREHSVIFRDGSRIDALSLRDAMLYATAHRGVVIDPPAPVKWWRRLAAWARRDVVTP